mgnify:CR=1 FL=1
MRYPIEKDPHWLLATLLGLQQYLIMWGATFGISVILAPSLCVESEFQISSGRTVPSLKSRRILSGDGFSEIL